jgi:hypothetical protein
MKRFYLFVSVILILSLFGLNSCKEETPAPTCEFESVVDGYEVTFTSTVTDVNTYLWEFGDEATSTEANPVHEYEMSGTYTVKLTVKGDGGEATISHDVETLPSYQEMLSGGPAAVNGKTWVLSTAYVDGVDGGSAVDPSMMILFGSAENVLTGIGFGDEYADEFTFYSDGTYKVDNKNGKSLASLVFGLFGGLEGDVVRTAGADALGLCTKAFTPATTATWTFHEEDLVVEASSYGAPEVPAITYDVTFPAAKWVELTGDVYFGIFDYPTIRKFIIKSMTPESMSVAIFVSAYWADAAGSGMYPALMYHQTYIPKP